MSYRDSPWIILITLLLLAGFLIGQRFIPVEPAQVLPQTENDEGAFRRWFWETRSLDLAVQVGMIFVGALGIAALLPRNKEGESE